MKVAVIEKPGKLGLRDVPMPEVGEYDVLCKMLYGTTCTGTDGHMIAGRLPFTIHYPTIIGHESIGEVVEVGKKVVHFKPGDRVTRVGVPAYPDLELNANWGGFAEYGIAKDHWTMVKDGCPLKQWNGFRVNQHIPTGIDPKAATMIITWRETLSYLQRMGLRKGHRLLVVGSGGNGLSFAVHAINAGAESVVMIGSAQRAELSKNLGVASYIDYREPSVVEQVKALHNKKFDFIIDSLGKQDSLNQVLPMLNDGGTIGIYGLDDGWKCQINPRGVQGSFRYYNSGYDEEETHAQVITAMQKGLLQAEAWMDLTNPYSLDTIEQAYDAVANRHLIKALVKIN